MPRTPIYNIHFHIVQFTDTEIENAALVSIGFFRVHWFILDLFDLCAHSSHSADVLFPVMTQSLAEFVLQPNLDNAFESIILSLWKIIPSMIANSLQWCFTPRFHFPVAQTIGIMIFIAYINAQSDASFISLGANDLIKAQCVDSNGTIHGLFSTWMEKPSCRCTCYPIERMAVSVCDNCSVNQPKEPQFRGPKGAEIGYKSPLSRTGNAVKVRTALFINPVDLRADNEGRKSCIYTITGIIYRHAEAWMSANAPCVKCRCNDGVVRCTDEPHHCPLVCLPGQKTISSGPCCETSCQGTALQNMSVGLASCSEKESGKIHPHGTFLTFLGTCVDQKCHCVNGRWKCLDYCVPLLELPCGHDQVVMWSPFCCPRCPGSTDCVAGTPDGEGQDKKTARVEGPDFLIGKGAISSGVDVEKALDRPQESFKKLAKRIHSKKLFSEDENVASMLIPPGREVATQEGRCICLSNKLRCAKPGRNIWHDDDCYFAENSEGIYYPPGAHWVPHGNTCTDCRCLENKTYICTPQICTRMFLCPRGQSPTVAPGDCCPSYCTAPEVQDVIKNQAPESEEKETNNGESQLPAPSLTPRFEQDRHRHESYDNPTLSDALDQHYERYQTYKSLSGCAPLGGANTEIVKTRLFPHGSRLILNRPCRSLLCVCAKDNRWSCADYCPLCIRTFQLIENMQEIPLPPAGRCCPPCEGHLNPSSTGDLYTHESSHFQPQFGGEGVMGQPNKGEMDEYREYYGADQQDSRFVSLNRFKLDNKYNSEREIRVRKSYDQMEDIRGAVRDYVLIATALLFCVLGIPLVLLLTCYLAKMKRRRRGGEYRLRLQRRRHRPVGTQSTERQRIRGTCSEELSSISPSLSSSQIGERFPALPLTENIVQTQTAGNIIQEPPPWDDKPECGTRTIFRMNTVEFVRPATWSSREPTESLQTQHAADSSKIRRSATTGKKVKPAITFSKPRSPSPKKNEILLRARPESIRRAISTLTRKPTPSGPFSRNLNRSNTWMVGRDNSSPARCGRLVNSMAIRTQTKSPESVLLGKIGTNDDEVGSELPILKQYTQGENNETSFMNGSVRTEKEVNDGFTTCRQDVMKPDRTTEHHFVHLNRKRPADKHAHEQYGYNYGLMQGIDSTSDEPQVENSLSNSKTPLLTSQDLLTPAAQGSELSSSLTASSLVEIPDQNKSREETDRREQTQGKNEVGGGVNECFNESMDGLAQLCSKRSDYITEMNRSRTHPKASSLGEFSTWPRFIQKCPRSTNTYIKPSDCPHFTVHSFTSDEASSPGSSTPT
ncbi:unnamed protein product [Calicophoron daubneyi]|uniref:VWFC domain-containing protein n=1 Tax=Calicophoron daubneyi TaxID=300641 RepID=A0AAV2T7L5_CALDB